MSFVPARARTRRRSRNAGSSRAARCLFPQEALNDPTQRGRRSARARGALRQAGAVAAVRRRSRGSRQLARAGGRSLAPRSRRSRHVASALVAAPTDGDHHARPADRRCRQAVHSLGQDRHPQPHRPLRAPRLPQRRRLRIPRGHRRPRCGHARQRDVRSGVAAALHAEPRAVARSTLDGRPAGCRIDPARGCAARSSPTDRRPDFGGVTSDPDTSTRCRSSTASITCRTWA